MPINNRQIFSANLVFFMSINNVSRNQLSEDLQINYRTLCDWIHARKYPRIDKIEKLANYFGVTKAALIEQHENSMTTSGLLHITEIYDDMNEAGQKALVDYADFLYSKPENKKGNTLLQGIAE